MTAQTAISIAEKHTTAPVTDRIRPHLFFVGSAIFHYLGPATAVIIGIIVLSQIPVWIEIAAVGLVIAGLLIHRPSPKMVG